MDQTIIALCGEGPAASWFCAWTYQGTGSEVLARLAQYLSNGARIILVLVVAWVVARLLRRVVTRFGSRMEQRIEDRLMRAQQRGSLTETQRYRTRRLQRLQAIIGVMRGLIATIVWLTAFLVILSELGVRLQPVLAGAGLIGVLVGFGAQQLVRDVIAGIAMLIEDQYGVGDWIEVDGKFGQVERVGLRSTAFRDIDGVVHHVLNGYIQRVGNLSQHWARATLDVPVALDADIPATKALIHRVASELADDPVWGADIIGPPEIWGVQEFGPEGIRIRLVIPTKPLRNWDITRQLRERIKFAFDQAHIRMPSQLVEMGGQRIGYAVLTRDVDEAPLGPSPHHHQRLVRPDDSDKLDADLPDRDVTEQLRIDRGPQPRPD
ncbi:MAG: mechanosensitive ion channel family protein [Nitriliruptoraceae bacterium]